jgi:hypothetical protein
MNRVEFASQILLRLDGISTLLDVGCRGCELKGHLPSSIAYSSVDLKQNAEGTVTYVGDVVSLRLIEQFDCVVALDILEHVEDPGLLFDRLAGLTRRHLLISLPNCYDLKGRIKFSMHGTLGGKYLFTAHSPLDRHRWLMGRQEILEFYSDKARQHGLNYQSADLLYGNPHSVSLRSKLRALSRFLLPRALCTSTVLGIFDKQ